MIRTNSISKYEHEVLQGLQEFFNKCRLKMADSGDLLLCQQNGFIDYKGYPCVGIGKEGYNNFQHLNSISYNGIGDLTDDDNYFDTLNSISFNGTSEYEYSLRREKNTYLTIWENTYFLRVLTQTINTLNGLAYDWHLDISQLTPNGKNKYIRENIIKRLKIVPTFQNIVKFAYDRNIRNAIAHSQYHCVQGGIMYDNYQSDEYATLQGLSFEEWEKKYIFTYFIFIGLFQVLQQFRDEFYFPLTKITPQGGIPVRIPNGTDSWQDTYLYPNERGDTWRFTK